MKSESNPSSPEEVKPEIFSCTSNILQLYKCQNCNFNAELSVVLHNHVTVVHKSRKILNEMLRKYYCENCEFQTWSLLVLMKHFMMCKDSGITEWLHCELCAYKTVWKFELKNHVMMEHWEQEDCDWSECEQCSDKPAETTKPFEWVKCDYCPFKTISSSGLKVHMSHCHENSEDFKWAECDQCSFKSKWDSTLKRHMTNIHKRKKIDYSCHKCPITVTTKHQLASHIIDEHLIAECISGLIWFNCERCSYTTTNKESLKIHIICHIASGKSNKKKRACKTSVMCKKPYILGHSSVNKANVDTSHLKSHILAKWGKIKANWGNTQS